MNSLFLAFGHITLAVKEKWHLLGFIKFYLLLRCQVVCFMILLGDLSWLTHVERDKLNISTKHEAVQVPVNKTCQNY